MLKEPVDKEKYISLSDASKNTPYSQEYLSLLARKGKLQSKKIGRNWFTTHDAIDEYLKQQGLQIIIPKSKKPELNASRIQKPIVIDSPEAMAIGAMYMSPSVNLPVPMVGYDTSTLQLPDKIDTKLEKITGDIDKLSEIQKKHLEEFWSRNDTKIPDEIITDHKEYRYIDSPSWSHRFHKLNWIANRLLQDPKKVLAVVVLSIALLFLIGGGLSFGKIDELGRSVSNFFKNADSLQGHFAGTHNNEVLLLDENGNIIISGHIQTEGQFRSFAPDGVAPIIVDSKTLVENLNAEYFDSLASKDFTLAFVTKNGNITYDNVRLMGNVEVGKTLTVRGATKLMDSLSVYGKLGVFSEAIFGKDIELTVGNIKIDQGTIEINNKQMIKNLNSEYFQNLTPADFTLDRIVTNGNSTNKIAFFNGGIYGGDGAFSSLGVAGDVSMGDSDDPQDSNFTVYSKQIRVNNDGDLTIRGNITIGGNVLSNLISSGSFDLGSAAKPWRYVESTGLHSSGYFAISFRTLAASATLDGTYSIVNVTNSSAVITLPSAVGITDRQYTIKNSSGGSITPATTGGQTIDGAAPTALTNGSSIILVSDGSNWKTIISGSGSSSGSSGGGTLIGKTTATTDGSVASGSLTGYPAANEICTTQFAGSHICQVDEILNTINGGIPATFTSVASTAWIANGPPGYTANANDCVGYTNATNTYLGAFWLFKKTTGGEGWLVNCSVTKPIACCK